MRKFYSILCGWIILCCAASCVNALEDEEDMVRPGTTPISFSGKVSKLSQTRATDKALEVGDEIGLYAMVSGSPIQGSRYIDNLLLRTTEGQALLPDKVVYYPEEEGVNLDFRAYYPYSSSGIAAGSSRIRVSVEGNQRVGKSRSQSDFLVAAKNKVGASKESVTLTFKHKLAKVKVELVVDSPDEVKDLLACHPEISACGFMTQAFYDFTTDAFTDLTAPTIISLGGEWKKSGNKLIGKEMIVIPQSVQPDQQYMVLEVRGRLYTCKLSESTLDSNSQRVVSIAFHEAVESELTGLVGEVQDWNEGAVTEELSESVYQMEQIQTDLLSCAQSNIYHIYSQGQLLAELCKEYLRFPDAGIDSPAWVVYPAKEGEVDLSKGVVLELLEGTEDVHGGSIAWNKDHNTAVYVPGTSRPIRTFYFDNTGKIVFSKPETSLEVRVKTFELKDVRGNKVKYYGLVKIGSQYWMREELKATSYADGTPLKRQQEMNSEPCYLCSEDGQFFYNREALNAGNMATDGWRVPRNSDWKCLVDYVGSAAVLKAGKWVLLSNMSGDLAPATNRAMFDGYPAGMWMEELVGDQSVLFLWGMDDASLQAADQGFCLAAHQTDVQWINVKNPNTLFSKGLSLRLLRR